MEGNMEKRIGISGGTFDPIHIGHLITAQEVKEHFELEKVLFIPVGTPPHKDINKVTSAKHRMNMVINAVKDNVDFVPSNLEVNRYGYTYAIDTLKQLKECYGNAKFYYIIGADVVFDLLSWQDYERVFEMCEFVAVLRPEFNKDKLAQKIKELKDNFDAIIHTFQAPLIEVSSTMVRDKIAKGLDTRYFLRESVHEYIFENKLYK